MIKQLFTAGAFVLALTIGTTTPVVYAEESVITTEEPIAEMVNCPPDMNCVRDIIEPIDTPTDASVDCEINPTSEECIMLLDDCAEDDTDCIEAISETEVTTPVGESEEDGEVAMWPVYLSLGALGLALFIFLLFNLCGKRS